MSDKRIVYRRYEDRRVAVMLKIYEALFNSPKGASRDQAVLSVLCTDYDTDAAALLRSKSESNTQFEVTSAFGEWVSNTGSVFSDSSGMNRFKQLQDSAPGALTFTRVKRPTVFPAADWDQFWDDTLSGSTMALLSVPISPQKEPPGLLWILQSKYSREWSSRDRSLAEEVADLLARAIDKDA